MHAYYFYDLLGMPSIFNIQIIKGGLQFGDIEVFSFTEGNEAVEGVCF